MLANLLNGSHEWHEPRISLQAISGGACMLPRFLFKCGKESRVCYVEDDDVAFVLR